MGAATTDGTRGVELTNARTSSHALGIDLGGTKAALVVLDEVGGTEWNEVFPIDHLETPDEILAEVARHAETGLAKVGAAAVVAGVGVAAQVDPTSGVVDFAPNLRWRNLALGPKLHEALGIPVLVTNDVRAAAWGEWRHGAGRGVRDLVCIFIGTGVGGGIVSGDQLLAGAQNTAGEVGHMTIVTGGRQCRCPNRGCFEAYVGGWAIAERVRESAQQDPAGASRLVEAAGGVDHLDAAGVAQGVRAGDPFALRFSEGTMTYLAAGLVGLVNALSPSRIILGGGVVEGWPWMLEQAPPMVQRIALPAAARNLTFVPATLGRLAVAIGAASWARSTAGTEKPPEV